MKALAALEKSKACWFLLVTTIVFFLLRLPSLFEPYWYGDEGIYQTVGMALREGRLLYQDIWDNKPPLLYLIYAAFGSDQFAVRLFSLIVGEASVIAFFLLSEKLFTKRVASFTQTAFFTILFAIPTIEGNIANAENFMLLPTLIAALLLFSGEKHNKSFRLFIAGVLLSVSFLIKVVAFFDWLSFFLFLLFLTFRGVRQLPKQIPLLFPFMLAFSLPILATALSFAYVGSFGDFATAVFSQNVGYVGYGNRLLVPQGLLLVKLAALILFVTLLFLKRRALSGKVLFILLWLSFSTFNAFFSQRPYTHYLLVMLPSFSLFLGLAFTRWGAVTLTILLALVARNFTLYDKTFSYYKNFADFISLRKSTDQYQAFFDRNTPKDYEIAQFIRMRTDKNDRIFIWGNNAQVYTLARRLPPGRFTVAYHVRANQETLAETEEAMRKGRPRFVVVTAKSDPPPFAIRGYAQRINIRDALIYERVF